MATEAENFFELALLLAENGTDQVHFIWHQSDTSETESKIEQLTQQGWIPIALMGVAHDGHLIARPLREHQCGNGIRRYLRRLMDLAAGNYEDAFGEPLSRHGALTGIV